MMSTEHLFGHCYLHHRVGGEVVVVAAGAGGKKKVPTLVTLLIVVLKAAAGDGGDDDRDPEIEAFWPSVPWHALSGQRCCELDGHHRAVDLVPGGHC